MNQRRDIIVIGTSVGGIAALKQIMAGLPAGFPAAVFVAMHIGGRESLLPEILSPNSALPVRHAVGGETIEAGTVLIAPPDHHMLLQVRNVLLSHGPKENFARPAIDPLFRSAAFIHKMKVIGVVLTGNLDDGTVGLQAIKACGGTAIVQDPAQAGAPSMPQSALEYVNADYCLPLDGIAAKLIELVDTPLRARRQSDAPEWIPIENELLLMDQLTMDEIKKIARPSTFTCPECQGSLWEINDAKPQRFRCHTGHAFTARTLARGQDQAAEEAIWAAVRALHEKETLMKRFAQTARDQERLLEAAEHTAAAGLVSQHAAVLRKMISE